MGTGISLARMRLVLTNDVGLAARRIAMGFTSRTIAEGAASFVEAHVFAISPPSLDLA